MPDETEQSCDVKDLQQNERCALEFQETRQRPRAGQSTRLPSTVAGMIDGPIVPKDDVRAATRIQ